MPGVDGRDQQHAGSFEAPPGYLRRLDGSMMVTKTGEGSDARLSGMRLSAGSHSRHRAHGKYGACVRKSEWLGIDLMARALRNELVSDCSKRAGRDYLNSARTRTRCARHESVAERYRDAWLRSRHRALLVVTAAHGYHAWCLSASYSDQ